MRKRRFLAWLMTMVMAIGLMPATALAADYNDPPAPAPVTSVSTESDNPIQITKSVNEDGNAITMEAYVTNEVTMQDKSKPMDIVLVLDVSGSMAKYITSYQYVATQSQGWSYDDIDDGDYDYYYKDRENYYKVSAKRSSRDWQGNRTYWLEANGQQLGTTSTSKSTDVYTGVLYTRQAANSVTKMAALQSAVNNFIDSVAKDAADNNVAHRISIVKFAGTKNNVVGDDKYDSGQYKYNYSQIVKTLTGVSGNGAGNLKTAVNNLTAAGATSADYGLELAKTVLANSSEANGKAVVMFTDGEPNHGSGFDESVAATAVNTAKNLKDSGAKVFTVGVFDQTYSDTSDVGKYMNAVSSNYPSATASSWGSWWSVNLGVRAEGNFYYTASNAGELDDVFQSISEEISNLTVTADVNAVLTDTLSDKFEFGAAVGTDGSGVTVKKVPVTGKTEDGYTWGSPVDVTGVNVTVNKGTGKIDVKGFDYTSKENAVTAKTVNGNTTYSGYKLVLTFPIAPKADADWEKGTHYYDTNKTAGLTNIKKDNKPASELLTDSPQVPVTAYGVTYDPNGGQNPPADAKGYLSGTEATVLGAGSMTKAGYRFTGWKDDAGKDYEAGGKITMTSDVTLHAQWTAIDYKVTYQWTGAPADVTLPTDNKTDYHVGDFYTVDSQYTNTTVVEVKNAYGNVIEKYTFSGWKLNGAVVTGTQTMPAADVTLTGVWTKENVTPDKYDVTYEYTGTVPQGAPAVPTKASYEKNQPVTVAAEPILDGYEFSGWETTDVTVSGNTFTMPAKAVAFKGSWTRVKFDVTYDGNGATSGTAPEDSKRYAAGDTVTVLGNTGSLARTGYDFVEWNTAQDGNGTSYKPSDTFFMGSADVTLFAQWIRQGQLGISKTRETTAPTLTSGTVPTEVTYGNVEIPYAGSVTLLYKVTVTNTTPTTLSLRTPVVPAGGNAYTVVEDDGATYVGYYAANGVAAPTSAAGTTVSGVLGPNESIDLYFTKTFVANDVITSNNGATVVTNTATLGEGKPADTEETPAVVKVTVTFDTQGGSTVDPQTFDKGGKATKPADPTRDGYDFTGWYTTEDGDDEFDFDDPVNADTTVYAQWIPKGQLSIEKTRVIEVPDGLDVDENDVNDVNTDRVPVIEYGGEITLLYKVTVKNSNPVPPVATFTLAPGGSEYTVVDDGATYVGYYAANGVAAPTSAAGTTVSGVLGPKESIDLYFTKTFEADDVENGKVFNTAVLNGTDEETDDGTDVDVEVRITFDKNALYAQGETYYQDVISGKETDLIPNQFTATGHSFAGWSTTSTGDVEYTDQGEITVTEDTTLYAKWTANTKYMVAYIANGGSGSMPFEFYNSGEKVTVKDCAFTAPTGKVFAGWSTTAKGTVEYEAEDTFTISSNTQLYAIWKDEISAPTQYILTYHANDGSNYTKEEAYPAADELVIVKDDNMFSKPVGKKFTGWSFSANGNAEVKPGDMFLIRQNTDLYAVWEDIEGVSVQKTIEDKQEGPYQFGDEVTFRIVVRNDSDETVNDLLLIEEPGAGLEPVEDPWSLDAARKFLMKLPIMLIPDFAEGLFDLDNEPVVDEPKVDEPKADEPVVDEPVVDEPVVDEPKVDEPVVDEPKVDEPVVDEPVVEEPVVEEPKVDEPKVDEPTEFVVDEVAEVPAEALAFAASVPDEPYLVETEDGLCVIIPELNPGEEIEFFYTVEVVDTHEDYNPADYTNRVYIDGVEDAEDEVLVPVTGIEIEKSVEKNSKPEPGEWVIYEIVVTNTGAFDLTDVTVTEMPDDEYVDGYFCDENGKEDEDAVDATTYFIDELGAGEDVTLYYRAKVSSKAKDGDELLNDVTVTGTLDNDEKVTATDSNDDVIVEKESRGGIPSKDRPTKPSKVEEVLNTEDHFQYVQGYPDNTVGPERNITRAEATVIFFRLLNDSVRAEYLDAENAFPDVNMNDWFNLGVSTMENGGFVSGYDDGLFRPNANITRAELATIISNFDDLEPAAENKFADVEGHWAEKYINSAAEKGWLSGYEDGLFRPNQYITRAETMSMINRVLDRRVDADGLHAAAKQWKDNPESKWYYYAVLEATNYHEYERADVSDYENWTAIKAEKIWEN